MRLPFSKNKKLSAKVKPVVLVVLDGFGLAPSTPGNAITLAKTPNYDSYIRTFPHTDLIASGESVGLPANEVGNTEVGHLTLGAGRVILQDLNRINKSIKDLSFFDNKAIYDAISYAKKNDSKLHIMGLVSSGNVHSSYGHLEALLQYCKKQDFKNVFLHLFLDGRDAPPTEGVAIVEKLEKYLTTIKVGQIATLAGRYWGMDRDRRWDRTEKVYKAMVLGVGKPAASAVEAIKASYADNKTDEFVEPTIIVRNNKPLALVEDNDAAIFFNFRIDRPRQLTMAFVLEEFENLKKFYFGYDPETRREEGEVAFGTTFRREKVVKNLFFVTMTEYEKNLPVSAIAFERESVKNSFTEIISQRGMKQMHMSESEKERFVTYYFRGMKEELFPGEECDIVPSPKVASYDKKPEMSLPRLEKEFERQLEKDIYHFFVINFANPDMVAHTGDLKASITAIEATDKWLGQLVEVVLARDGTVFMTADHGNAEELITYPTSTFFYTSNEGTVNTDHSNNPVPLIVMNNVYRGNPKQLFQGALADVAPTMLTLLGIQVPKEMTGKNLLQ